MLSKKVIKLHSKRKASSLFHRGSSTLHLAPKPNRFKIVTRKKCKKSISNQINWTKKLTKCWGFHSCLAIKADNNLIDKLRELIWVWEMEFSRIKMPANSRFFPYPKSSRTSMLDFLHALKIYQKPMYLQTENFLKKNKSTSINWKTKQRSRQKK